MFEKRQYVGGGILNPPYDLQRYILEFIEYESKHGEPPTRGDISKELNIPRTTIYDAVMKAITKEKVEINKVTFNEGRRGRQYVHYDFVRWL